MDDDAFDRALVAAAFSLAADRGWGEVSVAGAARAADLPLDRARGRFLGRNAILGRFGRIADQSALAHASPDGSSRDRLFDLLMRRFDVLQTHRGGVLALRSYLARDPGLALALIGATVASMAWMLEASGIPAQGVRGRLRAQGLAAVWGYALRAWERDASEDLAGTMGALDRALDRAERAETWLRLGRAEPTKPADPGMDAPTGSEPASSFAPDADFTASNGSGDMPDVGGPAPPPPSPPPPPPSQPPISPAI